MKVLYVTIVLCITWHDVVTKENDNMDVDVPPAEDVVVNIGSIFDRDEHTECPKDDCSDNKKSDCELDICAFKPDIRAMWHGTEIGFSCCMNYCTCETRYKSEKKVNGEVIMAHENELDHIQLDHKNTEEEKAIREAISQGIIAFNGE